jgi:hypothetical protein
MSHAGRFASRREAPARDSGSSSPARSSRARASRGPSAAETGAAADARLADERARAEISARGFVSRFGKEEGRRGETFESDSIAGKNYDETKTRPARSGSRTSSRS